MATETRTLDDLTGHVLTGEGHSTFLSVTSRTEGRVPVWVRLDLSDVSHNKLMKALEPYLTAGTVIEEPPVKVKTPKAKASDGESGEIRAWGTAHPELLPNGFVVSDRGALPTLLKEAFYLHHALKPEDVEA